MYVVVLAGGSGTRLWPRSRGRSPKHLLNLTQPDATMLQETVRRIRPLAPPNQIYVVTNARHAQQVREQLPDVSSEHVLAEPVGRNSAPAIAYAAAHVRKKDRAGVMLVLSADHVILKEEVFRFAVQAAVEVAETRRLVTLGITPIHPETGYGYMEMGDCLQRVGAFEARKVLRFAEKPDLEAATQYYQSGRYVWNSGMFAWKAETILEEMQRHMPKLHSAIVGLAPVLATPDEAGAVERLWPSLDSLSIDYGVLEKSDRVVTLPVDIGWSDVGDWAALAGFHPRDAQGNSVSGDAIVLDSHNSLVYSSGRLIAGIGLDNLVVVDTGDAILICPKDRTQEVRRIVDQLKADQRDDLL
ncbi:MAG: sugar phosphate nucleotidyltransferase [Chloroflexota bacterium]|nr:sugar phosphate nucleotidyltransferase [Chloroflexota bacterium]